MFPGMGGMNPKQMQALMKQMGIKSEELPAEKVEIYSKNKKILIENPQITVIDMKGQKTFTIMGEVKEEKGEEELPEEDIELIMEQAKVSRDKAEKALKSSNGDLAEALESLKQ
jgi:nascent polypeptide-associated complex subunit alpha